MQKYCQSVWFCCLNQGKTKCKETDSWLALMSSVMCGTACAVRESHVAAFEAKYSSSSATCTAFLRASQTNSLRYFIFTAEGGWYCQQTRGKLARGCCSGASAGRLLFPSSCPPCCSGEWETSHVMFGCLLGKPLLRWKACLLFLWRWNKKLERSVNPLGWELWCSALGACFQLWK